MIAVLAALGLFNYLAQSPLEKSLRWDVIESGGDCDRVLEVERIDRIRHAALYRVECQSVEFPPGVMPYIVLIRDARGRLVGWQYPDEYTSTSEHWIWKSQPGLGVEASDDAPR